MNGTTKNTTNRPSNSMPKSTSKRTMGSPAIISPYNADQLPGWLGRRNQGERGKRVPPLYPKKQTLTPTFYDFHTLRAGATSYNTHSVNQGVTGYSA